MSAEGTEISFDALAFYLATDGLKHEQRRSTLVDDSRFETVAEHCWHLALLNLLLERFAPPDIDHARVRDLITVHDLVEVFAGDSWFYSDATDVAERESESKERLLAMLPEPDCARFRSLIDEFQSLSSREACYARALDVLHPMVLAYAPNGAGPVPPLLSASIVLERKRRYLEEFPLLWDFAQRLVATGIERGTLEPG